jgi:hypothetical protein
MIYLQHVLYKNIAQHVMQRICFKSIVTYSIMNKMSQLTETSSATELRPERSTRSSALVHHPAALERPSTSQSRVILSWDERRSYSLSSMMTEQPSELSPHMSRLFH